MLFVNNIVTRGLGGFLLPTAGLGRLVVVVDAPIVFDDVGNDGDGRLQPLLNVPKNDIIVLLLGTLLILDNEID